jgi:hypothetical protein
MWRATQDARDLRAVKSQSSSGISAPLTGALALFCVLLIVIATPAFHGQYFHDAEEQVSLFGAAYGPRLFYPGSNRILAVVPFLTSWLGTPHLIGIAYFAISVFSASAGLAAVAYWLPRATFYAFAALLLIFVVCFFGGGLYQFRLDTVHPYLIPFSFSLVCLALLLNIWPAKFLPKLVLILVASGLTIAAAGMNPSVAFLCLVFFTLCLAAAYVGRIIHRPVGLSEALAEGVKCFREQKGIALGISFNALAMVVIFGLSSLYKKNFPQYVLSNYSVGSYVNSGLSLTAIKKAFAYLIDFHARSGIFATAVSEFLIVAVLLAGFLSPILWLLRQNKFPISRFYLASFLLWTSSIIAIILLSQNAHVQLVTNFIQGRYYTTPYYMILLSTCLTLAVASVDFVYWASSNFLCKLDKRWVLRGVGLALICGVVAIFISGTPQAQIERRNPALAGLAETIKTAGVSAVLGNYWWIWELQYELNRDAVGAPRVTPVSIRTESFGLSAFRPIIDALGRSKSFRFACIEMKNLAPEYDTSCEQQIASYQSQGGFPLGNIQKSSQYDFEAYKITIFEQGLAHPEDLADCADSQVLLRANPLPASSGEGSYTLDEDSFVYLQKPIAAPHWTLTLTSDREQRELTVPRNSSGTLDLLQHTLEVMSSECRLLVSLSRGQRLHPQKTRLLAK